MPGSLDISLLRSPEWAFAIVEPISYEFWDIDGQRDTGRHHFEYSLWPYTDGLPTGELTRAGYEYNLPQPITPPFAVSGDVVVTAWKPAEDGRGWILRVQDTSGDGTTVGLIFDQPHAVTVTDLLERPQREAQTVSQADYPLHRHEILTLRLE
jgi:alpha-mannosidase